MATTTFDCALNILNKFVRTNSLCRLFKQCSKLAKVRLFRSFCMCFYDTALWCNYSSVTDMLLELGLPSFNTLMHNFNVSYGKRLSACDTVFVQLVLQFNLHCRPTSCSSCHFFFCFCRVGFLLFCLGFLLRCLCLCVCGLYAICVWTLVMWFNWNGMEYRNVQYYVRKVTSSKIKDKQSRHKVLKRKTWRTEKWQIKRNAWHFGCC